jgi:hypothetical protein
MMTSDGGLLNALVTAGALFGTVVLMATFSIYRRLPEGKRPGILIGAGAMFIVPLLMTVYLMDHYARPID